MEKTNLKYGILILLLQNLNSLFPRNSLVVQWLRCAAINARVHVLSLVGERRYHKPCNVAKKRKLNSLFPNMKGITYEICCAGCAQLYLTLCDPMDCSPPGSSVQEISQARILEWAAFPSPGIFQTQRSNPSSPHLLHWQADSLPLAPLVKNMLIWF